MAGRKEKPRCVGTIPEYVGFQPEGISNGEVIQLTVDEFETVRLIDLDHLSQDEAARRLEVARSTVAAIYERARTKLADALVNGKRLLIAGGNVRLAPVPTCAESNIKGEHIMRIAVTYENGEIFQHFGRTEQFKLYDVENGAVAAAEIVGTNGSGHGALAGFLKDRGVDALICGGIGGGAQAAMNAAGITFYGCVSGNADEAVQKLLAGTLAYDPNVVCSHHHEHHEGGCGHHEGGCGSHGCHG